MTNDEMKAALDAANLALVEKLGKQPYDVISLMLTGSGKWSTFGGRFYSLDGPSISTDYFEDPTDLFVQIMGLIAELPSAEKAALRAFQQMQAKLIDFGNANNIETKWLNPIVENARALAENALTYQAAE